MRFKGTIFLTLLLILLGFYLYGVEFPGEEKKKEAFVREGKLYHFEMHEISRITIRAPKGEVEFEYFPGHPTTPWRIFHPVETVANQSAAEEVANRIIGLRASRLVEAKPKELKEFGLDPAPYRVLVTINQTDTEIIELGDENLTGTDVYLRKGMGTSLYLVPAGIKELLNKDLNDWRQREIFPFAPEDILNIEMTTEKGVLSFKKETGGWSMESKPSEHEKAAPLKVRGDHSAIANLLGTLVNFRGERFIDFKKRQWKQTFGPPLLRVALQVSKVRKEATFHTDNMNPGIVYAVMATDFDPIFQIPESDLKAVNQAFDTYRDRRLIPLDFPEQIQTIIIKRGKTTYTLTKKNGTWWLEGEAEPRKIINLNRLSRLQTDLYHLQLDEFKDHVKPQSADAGLARPRLSIVLKDKNGVALGEMDFGRTTGEMIFAKSSGQPYPFLIKKSVLDLIPDTKIFLNAPVSKKEAALTETS
ncbi:MAG: DUF4340 domain-containing protein [Nitrospiria bacterium]